VQDRTDNYNITHSRRISIFYRLGYDIDYTTVNRAVALIAYTVSLPIFATYFRVFSLCYRGSNCLTCVSRNLDPVCHTYMVGCGLSLGCPLSMLYHGFVILLLTYLMEQILHTLPGS
jgi:hypothetical protein